MPRYQRKISPSRIYHIMIRGNEKKDLFIDDEDRERFIDTLRNKKNENEFELYAYCLMGNHVHLLINEKDNSIARIMKCINVSYAMYFNKKYSRIGHLFQDRFRSEVIDDEKYLLAVVRYIHNNPVKAKLVEDVGQYKWSSYLEYISDKNRERLINYDYILGIMSNKKESAIKEFIRFSKEIDNQDYFDVIEEPEIKTKQETLEYIHKFLSDRGVTFEDIYNQKGKIRGTIKHHLINELKSKTKLSSRDIGDLLGLSKSGVNNLISGR